MESIPGFGRSNSHTQEVNENVYTLVAVERRSDAKSTVEKAVFVNWSGD